MSFFQINKTISHGFSVILHSLLSEFSDDSQVIARRRAARRKSSVARCDYCAESDHDYPACPHRSHSESEDSSEDG